MAVRAHLFWGATHCVAPIIALLVTVSLSAPAFAQGKSQEPHGNGANGKSSGNGGGNGGGNANGGGASAGRSGQNTPSQSLLPATISVAGPTGASPFAWIDNASLMAPGTVWIGLSTVRWHGAGVSETSVPVLDAAVGLAPRVQLGVSSSRVLGSDLLGTSGGFGTTFVNAKIAVFRSDTHGVSVAVSPTLEILSRAAMEWAPADQSRAQWGLPVSVDLEKGPGRVFASVGHFTPGVWFAGAGAAGQVGTRLGLSLTFSHAWSSWSEPSGDPLLAIAAPRRNDLSGGVSVQLLPQMGVFASIGRTVATRDEDGAGTSVSFGFSWTAEPRLLRN